MNTNQLGGDGISEPSETASQSLARVPGSKQVRLSALGLGSTSVAFALLQAPWLFLSFRDGPWLTYLLVGDNEPPHYIAELSLLVYGLPALLAVLLGFLACVIARTRIQRILGAAGVAGGLIWISSYLWTYRF